MSALLAVVFALFGAALLFAVGSGLACEPVAARPAVRAAGMALMAAGVAVFLAVAWCVS